MDFTKTACFDLKGSSNHRCSVKNLSEREMPGTGPDLSGYPLLAKKGCPEKSPPKSKNPTNATEGLSRNEVFPELLTEVFGQNNYFYYPETDSTNNLARTLASGGYPEGTVVVAEMQTAGRGRSGRSWYSPAKQGIYLSIILRPAMPLREISRISLLAAVAVAETLEEMGLQPCIKWPNDILISNRKIAGILAEAIMRMDNVQYLILGIGLNINNRIEDFPGGFITPPTSALAESDCNYSRSQILQVLLWRLEYHYKQMLEGRFAQTLEKAKSMSIVIGREISLDTINGVVAGRAVDLDDNGFLLVRDQKGVINTVMSGEIFLPHSDIDKLREY